MGAKFSVGPSALPKLLLRRLHCGGLNVATYFLFGKVVEQAVHLGLIISHLVAIFALGFLRMFELARGVFQ